MSDILVFESREWEEEEGVKEENISQVILEDSRLWLLMAQGEKKSTQSEVAEIWSCNLRVLK